MNPDASVALLTVLTHLRDQQEFLLRLMVLSTCLLMLICLAAMGILVHLWSFVLLLRQQLIHQHRDDDERTY